MCLRRYRNGLACVAGTDLFGARLHGIGGCTQQAGECATHAIAGRSGMGRDRDVAGLLQVAVFPQMVYRRQDIRAK